jgi:hypothetical protein
MIHDVKRKRQTLYSLRVAGRRNAASSKEETIAHAPKSILSANKHTFSRQGERLFF